MKLRFLKTCTTILLLAAAAESLPGQAPVRAATTAAQPDAFASEPGAFLLAIPGVGDDFVLFADGQWRERVDGTATLTAYVQRLSAVDRDFFVELTFSGRVDPGDANYPPLGSPVTTLSAAAYAPQGPVDPTTWRYYTGVTGTMTGLRAFAGARVDVANVGNAQVGVGATNKNVFAGLAVDLDLTIVAPPTSAGFAPTGPASLRAELRNDVPMCTTHVDGDVVVAGNADRIGVDLPGVAADYLFLQAGALVEADDGTATLTTELRRQDDHDDRWDVALSFGGRVDPGDAAHPPAGMPVLALLPTMYAQNGGPIDPAHWRYYTTVTGTFTGAGVNAGGELQVSNVGAFQLGVGADGGNIFYGMTGLLDVVVAQQPAGRTLNVTGDAELRANLATGCIVPPMVIQTGSGQVVENVNQTKLVFTGADLGFAELVALDSMVLTDDDRAWFDGRFEVVDHETIELSIPQGLPAASYSFVLLNGTRLSNAVPVDVVEPTQPIIRTENDRVAGEPQHLVVHRGALGPAISLVVASLSDAPSSAPGIVDLLIGGGFSDLLILDLALHDPVTGAAVLTLPSLVPAVAGLRIYYQSALLTSTFSFPLTPTVDFWFTDYEN